MADYNSAYTGAEIDQGVCNGLAAPTTYAPIAHDSAATTYGKGTDTKYGHVKLSSSTSSTSGTSDGTAATPSAVKAAYDLANGKQDPATTLAGYGITDAATSAELGTFVRPNLLDNWYFVGGGSQQNGGQFPINQRGSTSYTTNSAYSIDRWYKRSGSTTISMESSGLKILCTASISAGAYLLDQTLEFPQKFRGMPFTCSVLVDSIQGTWAFGLRDAGGTTAVTSTALSAGLVSVSGTIQSDTTDLRFALLSGSGTTTNNYVVIKAMKLEIGSTQTLAHYDSANSKWVLNEVPNYEEELSRCQRYFYAWNTDGVQLSVIGIGYVYSSTLARIAFTFPVTMRVRPSLTSAGSFILGVGANAYPVTSVALEPTWSNSDIVRLDATANNLSSGSPAIFRADSTSARLYFSADL